MMETIKQGELRKRGKIEQRNIEKKYNIRRKGTTTVKEE